MPERTHGIWFRPAYTLRPGLLTRCKPVMTGSRERRSPTYFSWMRSVAWGLSSELTCSKPSMKPSSSRMLAMAALIFEPGIETVGWPDINALRILVNMSAIGSVMLISCTPTSLDAPDRRGADSLLVSAPRREARQTTPPTRKTSPDLGSCPGGPAHVGICGRAGTDDSNPGVVHISDNGSAHGPCIFGVFRGWACTSSTFYSPLLNGIPSSWSTR